MAELSKTTMLGVVVLLPTRGRRGLRVIGRDQVTGVRLVADCLVLSANRLLWARARSLSQGAAARLVR